MTIRITAKRDGFRRCGIAHPDKPVTYPVDRFTTEELKALKAEPFLIVEDLGALKKAVEQDIVIEVEACLAIEVKRLETEYEQRIADMQADFDKRLAAEIEALKAGKMAKATK